MLNTLGQCSGNRTQKPNLRALLTFNVQTEFLDFLNVEEIFSLSTNTFWFGPRHGHCFLKSNEKEGNRSARRKTLQKVTWISGYLTGGPNLVFWFRNRLQWRQYRFNLQLTAWVQLLRTESQELPCNSWASSNLSWWWSNAYSARIVRCQTAGY